VPADTSEPRITHEPTRHDLPTRRHGDWRRGGAALVFCAALALRWWLAVSSPGHFFDMKAIGQWVHHTVVAGVTTSYVEQVDRVAVPNHGPVEIALFAVAGRAYAAFRNPTFSPGDSLLVVFIKAVPVLFDSLTASLLFLALLHGSMAAALIGSVAYVVQPVALYDAGVWGQTDAIYGFFVLAAVYAASASRWAMALFLFALACGSKGNAIGLVPFFAMLAFYNRDRVPQMVAGGAVAVAVTVLPFVFAGTASSLRVLFDPQVPSPDNAPNLWVLLKAFVLNPRTVIGFGTPAPLRGLSYAIWIALAFEPMRRLCRRGSFEALSLAAAVCAYAFFLFAIGVRERYAFPVAALLVPILVVSWEGAVLYLCVSAVLLANMLGTYLWPPIEWVTPYIPSPTHLAMANLAVFAWLGWFAVRAPTETSPLKASPISARGGASSPASTGGTADSRRRGRRRAGG
jgi:hypothetical protein